MLQMFDSNEIYEVFHSKMLFISLQQFWIKQVIEKITADLQRPPHILAPLLNKKKVTFLSNAFLTATRPLRLIVLSCLLTEEGWTETPVDFVRSEVRVEPDFLPSLSKMKALSAVYLTVNEQLVLNA